MSHSADLQTLMDMGFSQNRAERALFSTQYSGPQVAMDWLFAHEDDPILNETFILPSGQTLGSSKDSSPPIIEDTTIANDTEINNDGTSEQNEAVGDTTKPSQAMSIKCDDCGKLFKSESEVEFHAAKTNHSNFSESTQQVTPLTAEEKAEQLQRIQQRLKANRLQKEEQEKQAEIQREKNRRITGRDVGSAKQKFAEDEMKRLADARRREKLEDKAARDKIKAEIEKDRQDRAAKASKLSEAPSAGSTSVSHSANKTAVLKDYTECKLQIRLPDGKALTHAFPKNASLQTVSDHILNTVPHIQNFTLMTSFPKKVFNSDDMQKSLEQLGLVPSAVLIISRTV